MVSDVQHACKPTAADNGWGICLAKRHKYHKIRPETLRRISELPSVDIGLLYRYSPTRCCKCLAAYIWRFYRNVFLRIPNV